MAGLLNRIHKLFGKKKPDSVDRLFDSAFNRIHKKNSILGEAINDVNTIKQTISNNVNTFIEIDGHTYSVPPPPRIHIVDYVDRLCAERSEYNYAKYKMMVEALADITQKYHVAITLPDHYIWFPQHTPMRDVIMIRAMVDKILNPTVHVHNGIHFFEFNMVLNVNGR
jgi:hypothetical protein